MMHTARELRPPAAVVGIAALLVLLIAVLVTMTAAPAGAQDAEQLDPAADFRTAPLVDDGTYVIDVVSGERVWVSVLFTNYAGFGISAQLTGVDVETSDELTLHREIVAPNLDSTVTRSEDISIDDGDGMSWSGGETDTNLWFLAFTLESTGQLGVRYTLELTLDGFEDVGSNEECGGDCTLDEDLAEIEDEITDLEAQVARCGEECADPPTEEELEATRDALRTDVDSEERAIAELCGGELCDSLPTTSSTPWPVVGLFGLTAAAATWLLVKTVRKRRAATT